MSVGYNNWTPGNEEQKRLLEHAVEVFRVYEKQLPLTSRQVYYRLKGMSHWQVWMERTADKNRSRNRSLTHEQAHKKAETSFLRKVYGLLEDARRSWRIPEITFENMRDDGYQMRVPRAYPDPESFYESVRRNAKAYRKDVLLGQPVDMRVHVEAAGMLPQVSRVLSRYCVPAYTCGGFDSVQGKWEAAMDCAREFERSGRSTVILHMGDLNAHGLSIYEVIRSEMLAFVAEELPEEKGEDVILFERVALVEDQVPEVGKIPFEPPPPSSKNHREKTWSLDHTCELDALDPAVMLSILREAVERRFDLEQIESDWEREKHERDFVVNETSRL
jgi:hypothetical protein